MILAFVVGLLVATFPATRLLTDVPRQPQHIRQLLGTLPIGIFVSALLGGVSAPNFAIV